MSEQDPKKTTERKVACSLELEFDLNHSDVKGRDVMYVLRKAIDKAIGQLVAELPEPRFTLQSLHISRPRIDRTVRRIRRASRHANPEPESIQ